MRRLPHKTTWFVVLVLCITLFPQTAFAAKRYPPAVERWRSALRAEMEEQHVPSYQRKWLEKAGMQVIYRESRGNERARSRSGKYVGLFQFSPAWGGKWRLSGVASIHRFVKVFMQQGKRGIRRHWRATCYI